MSLEAAGEEIEKAFEEWLARHVASLPTWEIPLPEWRVGELKDAFIAGYLAAAEKYDEKLKGMAMEVMERDRLLDEAVKLVDRGTHFSGHYSDCDLPEDDGECSCGANRFEYDAHIFLAKYKQTSAEMGGVG